MWQILAGTVLFAMVLIALSAWALIYAMNALDDGRDEIDQPHQVADRLGALTDGQVFSTTAQRRAEHKRRLHLLAQKARGPAKLSTFTPKGAA